MAAGSSPKKNLAAPLPPHCLWSITQTRATYGGLCGMPACGQAVGCGVCDTPELWCGAAGLCARVRACAGAAESLHTYIYCIYIRDYHLLHPPAQF